jgi:hypothetical protein
MKIETERDRRISPDWFVETCFSTMHDDPEV